MERSTDHRADQIARGDGPLPTQDPTALAAALERIRTCLHRWLERIEEQLDQGPRPAEELERAVQELEQRSEALRAEGERREQEWADRLEALEHDRRLLAEAWERLEQEQLSVAVPARAAQDLPAQDRVEPPTPGARPKTEQDNSIDRTILRQFETLRQDVRRKTEARRSP